MTERLRGGRFALLEPLGEGSQGRTFDGRDAQSGRPVAIKRFDVRNARAWKDVELAEREARVLSGLSHPRLPGYVDHFEDEGALYLVMEKIEGESLASLRKRAVSFSEGEVLRFLRDASEILDYLHGRAPQVIHRDVKPGNVIRRPDGSFAFVDFGAVREKLRPDGGSTVVGTFGYMAPEQFQGRAGPGTDVYAVGATALAMLTGAEPESLPHKGLAVDVRAALASRAGTPSEVLITVLEQMLAPDPDQRATRIAPLLERIRAARSDGKRDEKKPQEKREEKREAKREKHDFERVMETMGRDLERRVEEETRDFEERMRDVRRAHKQRREAERAARRASRQERRHHRGPSQWPWIGALFATVGLTIAIVVVSLVLQVLLPAIFTVMSWILSKRMQVAADAVKRAGDVAVTAMRRARERVQHGLAPPRAEAAEPDGRVRIAATPEGAPRVRVADGSGKGREDVEAHTPLDEPLHEETEEEDEAGNERRRRK